MATTNQGIVQKIKEARLERHKTQQDLAELLGKTPAAISDMERGKVQVSASDLSVLADYLQKPIEFFYGEEIGDPEIQDLLVVLRNQPPEAQKQSIRTVKMLLEIQQLNAQIKADPNKEISDEEIQRFLVHFLTIAKQFDDTSNQLNALKTNILEQLKSQGYDLQKLLGAAADE